MKTTNYISIDSIFNKLHREISDFEFNESDIIEWIGEALSFLQVAEISEPVVKFMKVIDFKTDMPPNLQQILMVAKHNNYKEINCDIPDNTQITTNVINDDCNEEIITNSINITEVIPYEKWTKNNNNYSVIRLANNIFFKTIVCESNNLNMVHCDDEYTIIGKLTKQLLFSFKEGYIALAYLRTALDDDTGYPLIPDDINYTTAITYYVKSKIAERDLTNGRENSRLLYEINNKQWTKYARQAKNMQKMPKTFDDYQDLLEQSFTLIPNHKRYYNYFGNLNYRENLNFKNNE